jgi:hypothetical protein
MTLAPGRDLGQRLVPMKDEDWVSYELQFLCAVPPCGAPPMIGVHHIEPRSRIGGPRAFVSIDGVVMPNTCRLCANHHRAVTGEVGGHKARIVWGPRFEDEGNGQWWIWEEKIHSSKSANRHDQWLRIGPLKGQNLGDNPGSHLSIVQPPPAKGKTRRSR